MSFSSTTNSSKESLLLLSVFVCMFTSLLVYLSCLPLGSVQIVYNQLVRWELLTTDSYVGTGGDTGTKPDGVRNQNTESESCTELPAIDWQFSTESAGLQGTHLTNGGPCFLPNGSTFLLIYRWMSFKFYTKRF